MDGARIVKVLLLSGTLLVTSHALQGQINVQPQRVKGCGMQGIHIVCNIFQGNTAHTAYRVGKVLVNDLFGDTDRLKDLRALIGLNGGNTHLGCDLYDSVKDCRVVIVYRCIIVLV